MAKLAKQISQYLKSQPWFKEYLYEIHVGGVIDGDDKIEDYIQGKADYYTISGAFDWGRTNAGYKEWEKRNLAFLKWYDKN
jgi:hypothetical protein